MAAAARYRGRTVDAPRARNDIWTGLLVISLAAMFLAFVLLLIDFMFYYGMTTGPADVPSIPAVVEPAARGTGGKPTTPPDTTPATP